MKYQRKGNIFLTRYNICINERTLLYYCYEIKTHPIFKQKVMIIFKTITETFFSYYRGFVQFCVNTLNNQPIIFCGTGFSN